MHTGSGDGTNAVILLAAGSGSRMRGSVDDKILAPLQGKPVFRYSLAAFAVSGAVSEYIVVYRDEQQRQALQAIVDECLPNSSQVGWAKGGAERQDSVLKGLLATAEAAEHVFIHDCARPLVTSTAIGEMLTAVKRSGAAVLAHRVADTIKRVDDATNPHQAVALADLDRSRLWAMETPQAFRKDLILLAYRAVAEAGERVTDDTAAVSSLGAKVELVENLEPNPKITTASDLALMEFLLAARRNAG